LRDARAELPLAAHEAGGARVRRHRRRPRGHRGPCPRVFFFKQKTAYEIKIESAPWPVVQSRMQDRDKNYDMVPLWKSTYYVDPNNWVGELYGSRYIGTRNSSYTKDAELDKWIDDALATSDQEKRRVLYEKAATKVT